MMTNDVQTTKINEATISTINNKNNSNKQEEIYKNNNKTKKSRLQNELQKLPIEIRNIISGGLAGMIAKTFVAPIDRIKLLYQITDNTVFRLRNIPSVVRSIIKKEGVSALWKGNSVTLLRVFPYAGLQFMSFDKCKSYLLVRKNSTNVNNDQHLTPLESLFAGSVAGAVSVTSTYPLDLARAQLAVLMKMKDSRNAGLGSILSSNFRSRGVPGLFRGVTPSLLGIVPYSGVAFAINEQAKRRIRIALERDPTTVEKMQCGALAGLFAQTLTYPLEVTRRRMQTVGVVSGRIAGVVIENGTKSGESSFKNKPASMINTMKHLYKNNGMLGFFKGVSMNWIKGPITFSISFTTYDIIKTFMMKEETEHYYSDNRNADNKGSSIDYYSRRDSNIPKNVGVADSNCSDK